MTVPMANEAPAAIIAHASTLLFLLLGIVGLRLLLLLNDVPTRLRRLIDQDGFAIFLGLDGQLEPTLRHGDERDSVLSVANTLCDP